MSETVTTTKRAYTRALKTYVVSQEDGDDRLVRAYTPVETAGVVSVSAENAGLTD